MKKAPPPSVPRSTAPAAGLEVAGGAWKEAVREAIAEIDRPGWRKFLLAMLALVVAFFLAVYSSIFAQSGNLLGTGVCATLALALAAYVAVTAVPYLARRTRLEWVRLSMDYRLTREGYFFIALIFLIAIAGLNTGNNLLYLILSSMLAAILMSGVLSLLVLTGVELEVLLPEHVFARRPVPGRIRLRNDKKRMPSFSITVSGAAEDTARARRRRPVDHPGGWKQAARLALIGVAIGLPAAVVLSAMIFLATERYGMGVRGLLPLMLLYVFVVVSSALGLYRWKERTRRRRASTAPAPTAGQGDRRILRQAVYFPFLGGGATLSHEVELEFPRRGLYREEGFALSTRFPFGFLEKTLRLPVRRDLWVYPAVAPTEEFYEILPMLSGEMEAYQKGRGHDLYTIRDMQAGDSARHVDWKASARTGSPKVREFAREDERRLELILDHRIGKDSATGKPSARALEQFEAAVEFCACLAWHFHEVDAQVRFRCGEFSTEMAPAGEIIYDVLRFLAEASPSEEEPSSPPESGVEENVFRIVCTALPRGSVPTALWSRSYFIYFDALRPAPEKHPAPQGAMG